MRDNIESGIDFSKEQKDSEIINFSLEEREPTEFTPKGDHNFDVLNDNGEKIGFVNLSLDPHSEIAKINGVYINGMFDGESYRNKGYGKAVYKELIKFCKDNNHRLVSFGSKTEGSIRVWESLIRDGLAEEVDGKYYAK